MIWDIEKASVPERVITHHNYGVNDVCWSKSHPNVFLSAGEDNKIILWDKLINHSIFTLGEHNRGVLSVDFNPIYPTFVLTGSDDKTVKFWDTRKPNQCVETFANHKSPVQCIQWSPWICTQFLSTSVDCSLLINDMNRKKGPNDNSILLYHLGHGSCVNDACWSEEKNYLIASVAENNTLNVWKVLKQVNQREGWESQIGKAPPGIVQQ